MPGGLVVGHTNGVVSRGGWVGGINVGVVPGLGVVVVGGGVVEVEVVEVVVVEK